MPRRTPQEHIEYIRAKFPGMPIKELVESFNKHFGLNLPQSSIIGIAYRNGIKNGLDRRIKKGMRISPATEFKKGHAPWSKGKKVICFPGSVPTQFKGGHIPYNHMPVGSEKTKGDGYVWVKIKDPNTWKQKHHLLWGSVYGNLPEGYVLIFLDGNRKNISLENLLLVTRGQLAVMCRQGLFSENAELTKAGATLAALKIKAAEIVNGIAK
jgi:hypothetical protein